MTYGAGTPYDNPGAPQPPGMQPSGPPQGYPPVQPPPYPGSPPPHGYPPSGSYPPPFSPPPRQRPGLILAIVGVIVVLLVVGGSFAIFATRERGNGDDNLSTQRAADLFANATANANATRAASAATTSTATTRATQAGTVQLPGSVIPPTRPPVTATATISATATVPATATAAPAFSGPTVTWTDSQKRITVRYPTSWKPDTFDSRSEDSTLDKAQPLLTLTGPDEAKISALILNPGGTLDADVQAARTLLNSDPKNPVTLTPTMDTTIGGEPAKTFGGSYMQNGTTVMAALWVTIHNSKEFIFSADKIGTHQSEINQIVGAAVFLPAGSAASVQAPTSAATKPATAVSGATKTWTDPENRVTVRYPASWQIDTFSSRDENSTLENAQSLVDFTGPDGVRFSVSIINATNTLDADVQTARTLLTSDSTTMFTLTPTQDFRIGGEPAKTFSGSYTQNGSSANVAVWFVDHGPKRFLFSADKIGTHRADIDAFIGMITFR